MSTTRKLLECLGRPSLMRLMRERGLPPTRKNDDRRTSLARSYRGDVAALVQDLNRSELVFIFRQATIVLQGENYVLPNPGKYRLDELRALALVACADLPGSIPGEFRRVSEQNAGVDEYEDEDEDEDEYDDEEDGGYDDEGDDEDEDDDEEDEEDEWKSAGELSPAHGVHGDVTEKWSRPRKMSRVFRLVGMDEPKRLRTTRFQELIKALRARGIEACLADDPAFTPLMEHAESPGIIAKLRLRIAAAPRTWRPAPRRRPATSTGEGGPTIVVQAGERPVSQRILRPRDYELAVLRLQLLTAVPSAERRNMPEWPSAYLAAATRGLVLRREEESLLRAYAVGLCLGNHSPYDAIPQLAQVLSPSEWEALLDDLVALNPFHRDMVNAIVEQIMPITTPRSDAEAWQSAAPIAEDLREPPRRPEAHVQEPLAASGRGGAGTEPPKAPANNVRDLGALAGMFDDE